MTRATKKIFYHQMISSRGKRRSTRSQMYMKHRGIIILIKNNSDVNTGDLKIWSKIWSIKIFCKKRYFFYSVITVQF